MLIHRGSVKDIYEAHPEFPDELIFRFSDRYSIFDWGEMPDQIPGKGSSLASMAKALFEHLGSQGVPHHYLGESKDSRELRVRRVVVPRNAESYYQGRPTWSLIPLEVIYRWGVPRGSSLLKRSSSYSEGEEFQNPLIEFTTKLERVDRHLSHEEARALSGATDSEWSELLRLTETIARLLQKHLNQLGLKLWDGKLEFAFGECISAHRSVILVDAIGLDEMRLTLDDLPLSKEILRQFYLNTAWYQNLTRSKLEDSEGFKERCTHLYQSHPENLTKEQIQAVAVIYQAISELIQHPNQKDDTLKRIRNSLEVLSRGIK